MGCLFTCCRSNIDKKELIPNLTEQEKESIANKRVQYLENKYPPQKPLDPTKRIDIPVNVERKHEQYIRDWRD